ncbi:MAG: hypothetical protein J5J06_05510 [Phycisphaerae bacterium]|nr:hypothetical protein [Phycisphaerae bacterium]
MDGRCKCGADVALGEHKPPPPGKILLITCPSCGRRAQPHVYTRAAEKARKAAEKEADRDRLRQEKAEEQRAQAERLAALEQRRREFREAQAERQRADQAFYEREAARRERIAREAYEQRRAEDAERFDPVVFDSPRVGIVARFVLIWGGRVAMLLCWVPVAAASGRPYGSDTVDAWALAAGMFVSGAWLYAAGAVWEEVRRIRIAVEKQFEEKSA